MSSQHQPDAGTGSAGGPFGSSQTGDAQPGGPQPEFTQPTTAPPGGTQPGFGSRQPTIRPLWKSKPDGITTFRHSAPLVLWWAWVIFLVINFVDIVVASPSAMHSFRLVLLLLLVTGVMYACTVHPRVDSDDDGVTIYNPLRDHRASWGAVDGIYLGDSVEFCCHRPAPLQDKTIYSWALYSRRRSRARSDMQRSFMIPTRRISARAPEEAKDLVNKQAAQIMATELGKRAQNAKEKGAAGGYLNSRWAWMPVAAILAPGIALVVSMLA